MHTSAHADHDGQGQARRSGATPSPWLPVPASAARPPRPENRWGIDYVALAGRLPPPPCQIIDVHSHVNGLRAAPIWRTVADAMGVGLVYTQVRIDDARTVRSVLGDRARFIAFPRLRAQDRRHAMTEGYLEDIQRFHDEFGARMIKLWNAPRMFDLFPDGTGNDLIAFDSPWRVRHAELASQLGMGIMVHVADPDTWFATRYADARVYLTKREHYPPLRRLMDRFASTPFIAAHMGGSPEDLDFLDELLTSHANLYLDTSATKWVVRELSKHPRSRCREFFFRWHGRILFGSDIVTVDEHLEPTPAPAQGAGAASAGGGGGSGGGGGGAAGKHPMADLADSPQTAQDLYASRYWALRMMFESDLEVASPIADPDLRMVDANLVDPLAAPQLRGLELPSEVLKGLYSGSVRSLFERLGDTPF